MIAYVCSPRASVTTGAVLRVDGCVVRMVVLDGSFRDHQPAVVSRRSHALAHPVQLGDRASHEQAAKGR